LIIGKNFKTLLFNKIEFRCCFYLIKKLTDYTVYYPLVLATWLREKRFLAAKSQKLNAFCLRPMRHVSFTVRSLLLCVRVRVCVCLCVCV